MSRNNLQDFWRLLADLFHELSWSLRIGLFGGMLLGLMSGLYLVSRVPAGEWFGYFVRLGIVFVVGMTALGAFIGLALGVVVELVIKGVGGTKDKDERKGKGPRRR